MILLKYLNIYLDADLKIDFVKLSKCKTLKQIAIVHLCIFYSNKFFISNITITSSSMLRHMSYTTVLLAQH